MSAITNPLLSCTGCSTVATAVNIDHVVDMSTLDVPTFQNRPASYQIIFVLDGATPANRTIVWSYTTKSQRDGEFDAIQDAVGQDIAS